MVRRTISFGEAVNDGRARIDSVLRGLARSGIYVGAGLKVGDVDPRADPAHCYLVSDKSLAIGGGGWNTR